MQLGSAVHALAFKTRPVIAYDGVRRGKQWDAFKVDHPDKLILSMAENYHVQGMAKALLESKVAVQVMDGMAEQTILFDYFGRKCRATPDVRGKDFVTDLKTAKSADPRQFQWASLRMAYHAQMKMQCEAAKVDTAYIVCVESAEPYPVTVFRVTDEALIEGDKLLTLWMERLINCEASQHYPPYVDCIVPLDVPKDLDLDYGEETDATL